MQRSLETPHQGWWCLLQVQLSDAHPGIVQSFAGHHLFPHGYRIPARSMAQTSLAVLVVEPGTVLPQPCSLGRSKTATHSVVGLILRLPGSTCCWTRA